ncbi:alpha-amylase family glycosyl hydrolase [Pelomonas sp. SE-A7]|uniref:alpha-amylase family glycosyl hydrolase n=1 Tax=Pelomonas sp. SE-A7 TaxID=3054953 RepID=UPI00259D086D|nr:alpha-amylase family glycosyl hydrolase [Pelomonas sp. SE-A7]MDM4764648.1 alpha-amylase family glycosyl hydrolase [Pelomonas sp. SE-A7]
MRSLFRLLQAVAATACLGALPLQAMSQNAATDMPHVAWSRQATIYQVNLRQHTQQGTIKAFAKDLSRIRKLGADILWFMPLQPIGKKERKGGLGSYYSISDYTAVNPEFGTLDDMKAMVKQAHGLGFKIILDWVPNHTAWDHAWTTQHKDWYKLNDKGEIFPVTFHEGPEPEYWTDVVALDYRSEDLRKAMISAMAFWLREVDLDGFRCDVASLVPTDFWERARRELDAIKPVFMLAESDKPELHRSAFDMTYSWDLADVFKAIGKGKAGAAELRAWLKAENGGKAAKVYPRHAYRMRFTSNHDFNSWHGTDRELYGEAYQALAALTFTLPGMPLVYGGQESRLDKRLEFFEKDAVQWKSYELQGFYAELMAIKHANPALANGQYGAPAEILDAGNEQVFAFRRQLGRNVVTIAVNLSAADQSYRLEGASRKLAPWGWSIATRH